MTQILSAISDSVRLKLEDIFNLQLHLIHWKFSIMCRTQDENQWWVINLGSIMYWKFCDRWVITSFSRRTVLHGIIYILWVKILTLEKHLIGILCWRAFVLIGIGKCLQLSTVLSVNLDPGTHSVISQMWSVYYSWQDCNSTDVCVHVSKFLWWWWCNLPILTVNHW